MNTPASKSIVGGAALALLGACTSLPEVTIPYYLPRTEVPIRITRALACSRTTPKVLYDAFAISDIQPRYVANTATTYYFSTERLDHRLSDSKVSFAFHEDGRLSGISGSATGKGQETIKAIAGVLTFVVARDDSPQDDRQEKNPDHEAACKYIESTSANSTKSQDEAKPASLTLTYEGTVRLNPGNQIDITSFLVGSIPDGSGDMMECETAVREGRSNLKPASASLIDHCRLRRHIGEFHLWVAPGATSHPGWKFSRESGCRDKSGNCSSDAIFVAQPASRRFRILQCPASALGKAIKNERLMVAKAEEERLRMQSERDAAHTSRRRSAEYALAEAARKLEEAKYHWAIESICKAEQATVAEFEVPDSAHGEPLAVRVPTPKAFGGNEFTLTLADSGAIKELAYVKTASGAAVPASIGALSDAFGRQSFADKTQSINDEADRIAALQRLARCKADPQSCE